MSAMGTSAWDDRGTRAAPMAMIYVGVPAYFVIVAFSLVDLAQSHETVATAVGATVVVLFSAVFLGLALPVGRGRSEQVVLVSISVMALLAVVIAVFGSTTAVYLAVVSAMAGDSLRPERSLPYILGTSAVALVSSISHGLDVEDAVTQPAVVLMVGLFTLSLRREAETNRELRAAREELARLAVANERVRFARDLHDLLGHSLTVIRAKSELASRLALTDVAQAVREIDEVEAVARAALGEVREAVTGYRRPTLLSEVANARFALESAGIEGIVTLGGGELTDEADEALGWVLREAVTNVVRHSRARSCHIETSEHDGVVVLRVVDDGGGGADEPGNGLVGVAERLAGVGGRLEAGNGASGGFQLEARVPGPP
jgi:two-component system sensor histidine kinase DesK